jgi:hypothetical protein
MVWQPVLLSSIRHPIHIDGYWQTLSGFFSRPPFHLTVAPSPGKIRQNLSDSLTH